MSRQKENMDPKPILKWVGGKTQILDKLIVEFPTEMNNYHEIFVGGGSVLFTLLSYIKRDIIKVYGKVYAYDINEPLIYMYKNIQTHYLQLYEEIRVLITEFNECKNGKVNRKPENIGEAKENKENYYYWIRSLYNNLNSIDKRTTIGSAMLIFLNKTCFRGIFRVGPKGFNVPYGNYKNPKIINKKHLEDVHILIQHVIFECRDFKSSLSKTTENDYIYLDPPYVPDKKKSFVGYTKNGFNIEDHKSLFSIIYRLTEQNRKLILSNADVDLVREYFKDSKYNIISIECKRTINSKNPEMKTKEVIIKNY